MNYALIEAGSVINVIVWDGNTEEWTPPEGTTAVKIPDELGVAIGWGWGESGFVAPPPPFIPPPTAAEVLADRDARKTYATSMIEPLADAVELDMATAAEVAALKAWKTYRVQLTRIEQQPGFPTSVEWPVAPN